MPKKVVKQETYKLPPTSGWTQKELDALERLIKAYGTDRSKLLRQLVRNASKLDEHVIGKLEKAGN